VLEDCRDVELREEDEVVLPNLEVAERKAAELDAGAVETPLPDDVPVPDEVEEEPVVEEEAEAEEADPVTAPEPALEEDVPVVVRPAPVETCAIDRPESPRPPRIWGAVSRA